MNASDYFEAGPQRALAEAAAKGRTEEIEKLRAKGADSNFRGKEGMTALIGALLNQNKKGYQYLLENGADPNLQMTASALTSDGVTDGNSAMSLAAMHEDLWYLEITLKHGGNPNLVNPVNGLTPIFECIRRDRTTQLKMLIAAGGDLNAQTKNGSSPIIRAVIANRYDLAHAMLQAGADPTLKTKQGTTIVSEIRAIRTDPKHEQYQWRSKVIEFLKARGIDVERGK